MVVKPKIINNICLNSHPAGCTADVGRQIGYVRSKGPIPQGPKNVLVIGSSTGYGLATRIAAAFGAGAKTGGGRIGFAGRAMVKGKKDGHRDQPERQQDDGGEHLFVPIPGILQIEHHGVADEQSVFRLPRLRRDAQHGVLEWPRPQRGQTGIDAGGSGVANYDIYFSENGSPFQRWLTATPTVSGVFQGTLGKTYAFYSVAVDQAGNREAPHGTPDAQTTVTFSNRPPVLAAIPTQIIVEGDTFSLTPSATDPDGDSISFQLGAGAPPGMVLNSQSGQMSWITGDASAMALGVAWVKRMAQVPVSAGASVRSASPTLAVISVNPAMDCAVLVTVRFTVTSGAAA